LPFSTFGPVSRSSSEPNKVSIFPTLAILLSIPDQVKCDSAVLDRELPGRLLRINIRKKKRKEKKKGRERGDLCVRSSAGASTCTRVSNRWFADALGES